MNYGVNIFQFKKFESLIIILFVTIVRHYDYALFGLSASVLSKNLMPGTNEVDQMLMFFAFFSVSMLARPLGAVIFGKIGDNLGRIISIKIAACLATFSTGMIAFIPNFSKVGWFAVVLLIFCRMIFLISLAGDVDAIKIYVTEKVTKKNRCFATGIVYCSAQLGVLSASLSYHMAISYSDIEGLWRIAFLLGGLLGCIVIFVNSRFQESALFVRHKVVTGGRNDNFSILHIIMNNKMKWIIATVIYGMLGGGYHFLIIFFGAFLAKITGVISVTQASSSNIILISIYAISCLASGYCADRVGMIKQVLTALIINAICVLLMCTIINDESIVLWCHRLLVLITPFYTIPFVIRIQSLFQTAIRMRMCSLAHSIGSMLFSATTPFFCMLIWRYCGEETLVITYFFLQLIVLICLLLYISKKGYVDMLSES